MSVEDRMLLERLTKDMLRRIVADYLSKLKAEGITFTLILDAYNDAGNHNHIAFASTTPTKRLVPALRTLLERLDDGGN